MSSRDEDEPRPVRGSLTGGSGTADDRQFKRGGAANERSSALYLLYDINRTSLKSLIDRVFARARLDLKSKASVEVRRCIREALNAHIEPFAWGR